MIRAALRTALRLRAGARGSGFRVYIRESTEMAVYTVQLLNSYPRRATA